MSLFLGAPLYNEVDLNNWALNVRLVVNGILNGKTNNTGAFTLTPDATTTVVQLAQGRLGPDTIIQWWPQTASAATEFGAGSMYVSSRNVSNATFTVIHANTPDADKTFNFILTG